jgi:GT2 family glycosyltransferase
MLVRREVFSRTGGFDVEMGAGARFRCEDIDFLGRASMAGFTGAFLPDLVVHHHHGRKPGPATEALHRANAHGRGAYYAKFIAGGHLKYLLGWVARSAAPWRLAQVPDEIRGAREYLKSRAP